MKHLTIIVELRKPRTKVERSLYGLCVTERNLVSRIFINSLKAPHTRVDTFFHEMAHAVIAWRGRRGGRKEEKAARLVGEAADKVFREVFK